MNLPAKMLAPTLDRVKAEEKQITIEIVIDTSIDSIEL
jgi:hypothetical protein